MKIKLDTRSLNVQLILIFVKADILAPLGLVNDAFRYCLSVVVIILILPGQIISSR